MKITTFTFSGTGNTRWAVETFNRILEQKGHQGEMVLIDAGEHLSDARIHSIFAEADYIGFANPIYGGDIPPIMRNFIRRIENHQHFCAQHKRVFVINTFGYANAFGPAENKKLLEAAGLNLVAYINIRLCNNVISTVPDAKPFDWELLKKRMTRGEVKLFRLADCLIAGKKRIKGHGPQNLIGVMIRKKMPEAIAGYYKTLAVNDDTCIRCMACVDHCPTGSIHFDEVTGFSFHPGCTACMRCYNFCPTGSITTDGVYHDPRQFPRYQGPRRDNSSSSAG